MNKIMIVANQPQIVSEQLSFARRLKEKKTDLDVIFFIGKNLKEYYSKWSEFSDFIIVIDDRVTDNHHQSWAIDIVIYLKKVIFRSKNFGAINFLLNSIVMKNFFLKKEHNYHEKIIKDKCYFKKIINKIKPDLIFLGSDRHLNEDVVFISIAKDLGIKTIIPYIIFFGEEDDLLKTNNVKHYNSIFLSNYIKKSQKKFSHQKRCDNYYYPHYVSNVLQKIGSLPYNPWFMGGGEVDILCLPNYQMKEHYIENGVKGAKIKVVGDVSYDVLYEKNLNKSIIKSSICRKYGFNCNTKTIVLALPQFAEHNILPWDSHWKEINFLVQTISDLRVNLLLSLHPKMARLNYDFLEDKYNCRIADEKLSDILVVGDVFVATYSSTVLWAVLCGVRTVVFDFYGFDYTIYDFLTSIEKVKDRGLLYKAISMMLRSKVNFEHDWEILSRKDIFDGHTIDRYIKLITEVK